MRRRDERGEPSQRKRGVRGAEERGTQAKGRGEARASEERGEASQRKRGGKRRGAEERGDARGAKERGEVSLNESYPSALNEG